MSRFLEWVNRWWKIKIGPQAVIGSTLKVGGKTFER